MEFQFLERLLTSPDDRELVFEVERDLLAMIKSNSTVHHVYAPMTSFQRLIVHKMVQRFGLRSHSEGEEGVDRHVTVTKMPGATAPLLLLADLLPRHASYTPSAAAKTLGSAAAASGIPMGPTPANPYLASMMFAPQAPQSALDSTPNANFAIEIPQQPVNPNLNPTAMPFYVPPGDELTGGVSAVPLQGPASDGVTSDIQKLAQQLNPEELAKLMTLTRMAVQEESNDADQLALTQTQTESPAAGAVRPAGSYVPPHRRGAKASADPPKDEEAVVSTSAPDEVVPESATPKEGIQVPSPEPSLEDNGAAEHRPSWLIDETDIPVDQSPIQAPADAVSESPVPARSQQPQATQRSGARVRRAGAGGAYQPPYRRGGAQAHQTETKPSETLGSSNGRQDPSPDGATAKHSFLRRVGPGGTRGNDVVAGRSPVRSSKGSGPTTTTTTASSPQAAAAPSRPQRPRARPQFGQAYLGPRVSAAKQAAAGENTALAVDSPSVSATSADGPSGENPDAGGDRKPVDARPTYAVTTVTSSHNDERDTSESLERDPHPRVDSTQSSSAPVESAQALQEAANADGSNGPVMRRGRGMFQHTSQHEHDEHHRKLAAMSDWTPPVRNTGSSRRGDGPNRIASASGSPSASAATGSPRQMRGDDMDSSGSPTGRYPERPGEQRYNTGDGGGGNWGSNSRSWGGPAGRSNAGDRGRWNPLDRNSDDQRGRDGGWDNNRDVREQRTGGRGNGSDFCPHILEVFGMPADTKPSEVQTALAQYAVHGLQVKWVDATHALLVFSTVQQAQHCLETVKHPIFKFRPFVEASKKAQDMAALIPPPARPDSTPAVAQRMIASALSVRMPRGGGRQQSNQGLREAKQKKVQRRRDADSAWNE